MAETYDVAIIGGGINGIATGIALLESKVNVKVIILEKEPQVGLHASGRNSGVLHSGFYYSPKSLRATFCKQGNAELTRFCKDNEVPLLHTGKVVVTSNEHELSELRRLAERGQENNIDIELLPETKLKRIEQLARTVQSFIYSPTTSVSDPKLVIAKLLDKYLQLGGKIKFSQTIKLRFSNGETILDPETKIEAKFIVNVAGVHSQKISQQIGIGHEYGFIPFLGQYLVAPNKLGLRTLVYPVPNPERPFLGVHLTKTVKNKIKIGPTAIPVLGKEQYTLSSKLGSAEIGETLKSMWYFIRKNPQEVSKFLVHEWSTLNSKKLVNEASYLVPEVSTINKWEKGNAGIRAQLVDLKTGALVDDFVTKEFQNSLHLLNGISPGWTCALPFGRYLAEKLIIPKL
jgi:L-2-hydroxyglutarate oxidase LhgO